MSGDLNLGIDFSQMKEVGVQERSLTSAADSLLTEEIPAEGNIGSETLATETVVKPTDKNKVEEEFDINRFLSGLEKEKQGEPEIKDEKTEEVTDKDKKDPSSKNTKPSSNVPFTLVFKSLAEEGVLSDFNSDEFEAECANPEVGTARALQNVFRKEAEIAKQEILSEQEEDFREYVSLLDAGIDRKTAGNLIQTQAIFAKLSPESLEGEEETALNYRKAVIAQNYRNTTTFSDEKITKMIDKLVKSGEDEEEAKEALPAIQAFNIEMTKKAKEAAIATEAQKQKDAQAAIKRYKETIAATDEIIPGQKINKQTKQKIEDYTLNGKIWELRNKDPFKFDTIVSYLALNGAFEGKFTKPVTGAKTAVMTELEQVLKTSGKSGVTPVTQMSNEDDENSLDFVSSMLKKATHKN